MVAYWFSGSRGLVKVEFLPVIIGISEMPTKSIRFEGEEAGAQNCKPQAWPETQCAQE
jgi:hypothetical protein